MKVSLHLKKFYLEIGNFPILKPSNEIIKQVSVKVMPAAVSGLDGETTSVWRVLIVQILHSWF